MILALVVEALKPANWPQLGTGLVNALMANALLGKMEVQVQALTSQLVVGDEIYRLHQTCSSQFSYSKSSLFPPAFVQQHQKQQKQPNEINIKHILVERIQTGRRGYP